MLIANILIALINAIRDIFLAIGRTIQKFLIWLSGVDFRAFGVDNARILIALLRIISENTPNKKDDLIVTMAEQFISTLPKSDQEKLAEAMTKAKGPIVDFSASVTQKKGAEARFSISKKL